MNRSMIYAAVSLFLGAFVALLSFYGLPQCHADHWMSCNYLVEVTGTLGLMIMFLSLFMLFLRRDGLVAGMQLGVATFGAAISFMAGVVVRACASPMMHCHSVTEPVLIAVGAAVAFWGVLACWLTIRR